MRPRLDKANQMSKNRRIRRNETDELNQANPVVSLAGMTHRLFPGLEDVSDKKNSQGFLHYPWSSFVEGDEELVWPNVRSMYGMMSGECCITFSICHKHNSLLPLGRQKQPSSPSTKELRALSAEYLSRHMDVTLRFPTLVATLRWPILL